GSHGGAPTFVWLCTVASKSGLRHRLDELGEPRRCAHGDVRFTHLRRLPHALRSHAHTPRWSTPANRPSPLRHALCEGLTPCNALSSPPGSWAPSWRPLPLLRKKRASRSWSTRPS